jgi:ATP-binding cassette, subfamily B, bacterial
MPTPRPAAEFVADGARQYDRSTPLRWLVSHLMRYRALIALFGVAVFATSVLAAALPRLAGLAFDVVAGTEVSWTLGGVAMAMVGVVCARGLCQTAAAWLIELLGQRLERDARDELYLSLLGKSQTFHNRQRIGDIMARATNDVRQLNPMMNPGVSLIIQSGLGIVVPVLFIAWIDLRLLAAPLAFVVAFGFAVRLYMRQLNPVSMALRRQFGVMNAGLTETITGIEVVKGLVQEPAARDQFSANATQYRDHFVQQGRIQARYLPTLLVGLAVAIGFAHGMYLFSLEQITLGELVAFMGLMGALRFPAFISIFTFSLVQLGLAGARRILDLMIQETELDENASGHTAELVGEVRFEGVHFGYGGAEGRTVLRDLSFVVPAGSTVAVVGQTGSGKSTLTKLLNRTYDVTGGRITLDGVDVREWNLESLRPQISVIEQDVFLFSRSIADNIAFGLGDAATPETIEQAALAAQADGFIRGFADGYDTVIGERGMTLSGGQRQRLAIARALLTDPRVLIIDDATSAIDSATEDAIQRAINAVLEGRTTFMITHRLSQIRRADLILVMDGGQVIDQGDHATLVARCPMYQRIFARHEAA